MLAVVERDFRRHPRRADRRADGPADGRLRDRRRCLPATCARRRRRMASPGGRSMVCLLTRIHRTASGGLHLLFRWPPERPVGCRVKGLPKGIEVKGEGGSIVFPPSERGGSKYSVVSDIEPAEAPDWLLDMVAPVRRTRTATTRSRQRSVDHRDGSPYGLKALDNACASAGQRRARRTRSRRRRKCARDWIARRRGRTR